MYKTLKFFNFNKMYNHAEKQRQMISVLHSDHKDTLFPLSIKMVESFKKEGYLIIRNLFDEDVLQNYQKDVLLTASERTTIAPNINIDKPVSFNTSTSEKEINQLTDNYAEEIKKEYELKNRVKIKENGNKAKGKLLSHTFNQNTVYTKRRKDRKLLIKKIQELEEKQVKRTGKRNCNEHGIGNLGSFDAAEREINFMAESENFQRQLRRVSHGEDIERFFLNADNSVAHLYAARGFRGRYACGGVGAVVGRLAAELGGCLRVRLHSDLLQQRHALANALPLHIDAAGVNFTDGSGVTAQVLLPRARACAPHTSARVVVPGSHRLVRECTRNGET